MEERNHKYRICFVDYIWIVAEKWSQREHNNLNGGALLFFCWLFAGLIPLGILLIFHFLDGITAVATLAILCFFPMLFCKLRYTQMRGDALREHYRAMKHIGRKLLMIIIITIAITVAIGTLMFNLGFMQWSR